MHADFRYSLGPLQQCEQPNASGGWPAGLRLSG
jgi:hypothetical protein